MASRGAERFATFWKRKEIRERIHPIIGFEEFSPQVYFSEFRRGEFEYPGRLLVRRRLIGGRTWSTRERVNFRIMEEFERMGIEFAFPSRIRT